MLCNKIVRNTWCLRYFSWCNDWVYKPSSGWCQISHYWLFDREYAVRKTRDTFRLHSTESDQQTIQKLLGEAESNLIMLQRQVRYTLQCNPN